MCFRGPRFSPPSLSRYNKKHRHTLDCAWFFFFSSFIILRRSSFLHSVFNVDSRLLFIFFFALHASRFYIKLFHVIIIIIIIYYYYCIFYSCIGAAATDHTIALHRYLCVLYIRFTSGILYIYIYLKSSISLRKKIYLYVKA